MGRNPPNIVGSRSPTARSSILRSPSAVRILVPLRKQLLLPPPLPPPPVVGTLTQMSLNGHGAHICLAAAAWTVPSTAGTAIAPIIIMLRRVRCIPAFEFSNALVMVPPPSFGNLRSLYPVAPFVTSNLQERVEIPMRGASLSHEGARLTIARAPAPP